ECAGVCESWRRARGENERSFTIITTAPTSLIEPVHNRMPVILEDAAVDDWLYMRSSSSSIMDLWRPTREDLLIATPVSNRVNSVRNDNPDCPAPLAAQHAH